MRPLVNFILANRIDGEEITIIGVSHGGNVTLQAANILGGIGYKVNVIALNRPSYSGEKDVENPRNNKGINDMISIWTKDDPVAPLPQGASGKDSRFLPDGVEIPEGLNAKEAMWFIQLESVYPARQNLEITNNKKGFSKHSTENVDSNQIDNSELEKLKPIPVSDDIQN